MRRSCRGETAVTSKTGGRKQVQELLANKVLSFLLNSFLLVAGRVGRCKGKQMKNT
jgi:hypothetical protein